MEIERKYKIEKLPEDLERYSYYQIEQGYLCGSPVVRVRRQDSDYYMTYKSEGLMARDETNLPLTKESYEHLLKKCDGTVICKRRYLIPIKNPGFKAGFPKPPEEYTLTIELDVFDKPFAPLVVAEVEFGSTDAADAFLPPEWFGEELTYNKDFHNSEMSLTPIDEWKEKVGLKR